MRPIKSERLKKLETELHDLEQWLKLGLVPKKDIQKHREEIQGIQGKIEEEKERLQFLKESGEMEEYTAPKRPTTRTAYTEMPTLPDIDVGETAGGFSDAGLDSESEAYESGTTVAEDRDEDEEGAEGESKDDAADDHATAVEEENESYFSDRNRWRRGGIRDPDADEW